MYLFNIYGLNKILIDFVIQRWDRDELDGLVLNRLVF